jgi:hypothetical protein
MNCATRAGRDSSISDFRRPIFAQIYHAPTDKLNLDEKAGTVPESILKRLVCFSTFGGIGSGQRGDSNELRGQR